MHRRLHTIVNHMKPMHVLCKVNQEETIMLSSEGRVPHFLQYTYGKLDFEALALFRMLRAIVHLTLLKPMYTFVASFIQMSIRVNSLEYINLTATTVDCMQVTLHIYRPNQGPGST